MSEEIYLYPEELSIEPKFNSRLWPPTQADQERELGEIKLLAQSIGSQGQLDSCVCVVDSARPLPHVLVIGHRRRRALADLNAQSDERCYRRLRVRVDRTGKDPIQQAIISNLYEKSYSPMDMASAIYYIRKLYKWDGLVGTQRIAVYLGLQPATVMQYEKLLTGSDEETRAALHSGLITVQSAHDILHATASKRRDIIDLATKIESDELALGRKPRSPKGKRAYELESKRMFMRISRPSVLRAMEELGAGVKPMSKSRADIGKLIYSLDHRDYGFYNGDVRVWARAQMEWIQGVVSTEALLEKFRVMTKHCAPGNYSDDDIKYIKHERAISRMPRADKGHEKGDQPFNPRLKSKIYKGVIDL